MTFSGVVERVQLRPIVEAFSGISWPAPSEELKAIGARLGWTVELDLKNGLHFLTGLPVTPATGNASYDGDDIGQVSVDLTDRVRQPDAAQTKMFAAATRTLRAEVTSILGDPVEARGGANARITWDLPNGGRVAVARLNRVVQLIVLQKRYADIERREKALGVRDDRDPSNDPA